MWRTWDSADDIRDGARLVDVEVGGRIDNAVAQRPAALEARVRLDLLGLGKRTTPPESPAEADGGARHAHGSKEMAAADAANRAGDLIGHGVTLRWASV
jgi:hypothetical protein